MPKSFPSLSLEPGTYPAEWFWAGEQLAGELEIRAGRSARVRIFGEPKERRELQARSLPDGVDLDRIEGRLRMGLDVVGFEPFLETWFPGQTSGPVRHALVGLGISEVGEQRYERARLQITGLAALMEKPPVGEVRFPSDLESWEGQEFGLRVAEDSSYEWTGDDITMHVGFDSHFSGMDGYRFEVVFAPVVDLDSPTPLSVQEWIDRWIDPLFHLVSFGTKHRQKVSWVTFTHEAQPGDPRSRSRAQLFATGIEQQPHLAERPVFLDEDRRPLFTLTKLPQGGLPWVVGRWAALVDDVNPFVELFRSVLFSPHLPDRAKFLYLVQALETLHASENEESETAAQAEYAETRVQVLARLKEVADTDDYKFLKKTWGTRKVDSLTRRLEELAKAVDGKLLERLATLSSSGLGGELKQAGADSDIDMLRVLRNKLSHGEALTPDASLRDWVAVVEDLARAHLLRLLNIGDGGDGGDAGDEAAGEPPGPPGPGESSSF